MNNNKKKKKKKNKKKKKKKKKKRSRRTRTRTRRERRRRRRRSRRTRTRRRRKRRRKRKRKRRRNNLLKQQAKRRCSTTDTKLCLIYINFHKQILQIRKRGQLLLIFAAEVDGGMEICDFLEHCK
jgi:hypothetical protein